MLNEAGVMTKRILVKTSIRIYSDLMDKITDMSHGELYKSHYQVLTNDILDEAVKDKQLMLRVMKKRMAENAKIKK